MNERRGSPAGLAWADTGVALACALVASVMFCLNQDFPTGDLRHPLLLSMFVVPAAFLITLLVGLPALHLMLKRRYTHPLVYVLLPGVLVLAVCLLPILDASFSVLREGGRDFIADGKVVWENFGWYVLYQSEPAFWSCSAGLLFWLLRVRRK